MIIALIWNGFDISLDVKVKENGEDGDDGIDVGLDKHLTPQSETTDSTLSQEQTRENCKNEKEIISEITLEKYTKEP